MFKTDQENTQNLLNKIKNINKKYEKINNQPKYKFNIFTEIKQNSKELMHSNFIASLLEPKGNHFQEDVFLRLFLKEVRLDNFFKNCKNLKVAREKNNIDILIIDEKNKKCLIIENKIYASDQKEQLARYFKTAQGWECAKENIQIIYLTLYGHEPDEQSYNGMSLEDINLVSYRENIKSWIEECILIQDNNTLSVLLSQYLNLIKNLTNQELNEEQKMEKIELLKDDENLKNAISLQESIIEYKKELVWEFYEKIRKELKKMYKYSLDIAATDEVLSDEHGMGMTLYEFDDGCCLIFGIYKNNKKIKYDFWLNDEKDEDYEKNFTFPQMGWTKNTSSLAWKHIDCGLDFSSQVSNEILDFKDDEKIDKIIEKISTEVNEILKEFKENNPKVTFIF